MIAVVIGVTLTLLSVTGGQTTELIQSTADLDTPTTSESILSFDPPNGTEQIVHSNFYVQINISTQLLDYAKSKNGSMFFIGIVYDSSDRHLRNMLTVAKSTKVDYIYSRKYNLTYYLCWKLQVNNSINDKPSEGDESRRNRNGFVLTVENIGYPKIGFNIIERNESNHTEVIYENTYYLIGVRKHRIVDIGFTIVISVVGVLNIFAIGCMTEIGVLRSQFRKSLIPVSLAAGTQYIVTPLVRYLNLS